MDKGNTLLGFGCPVLTGTPEGETLNTDTNLIESGSPNGDTTLTESMVVEPIFNNGPPDGDTINLNFNLNTAISTQGSQTCETTTQVQNTLEGATAERYGPPFGETNNLSCESPQNNSDSADIWYTPNNMILSEASQNLENKESTENIFNPRTSLFRTPPRKESVSSRANSSTGKETGSGSDGFIDEHKFVSRIYNLGNESREASESNDCDVSEAVSSPNKKKRKRTSPRAVGESNECSAEALEIMNKMMDKVLKKSTELKKIVKASTKTKIEIRQSCTELDQLAVILSRKMKSFNDVYIGQLQNKLSKKKPNNIEVGTQTDTIFRTDSGAQVNSVDIDREMEYVRNDTIERIKKTLEIDRGFNTLSNILDEKWSEEIYGTTDVVDLNRANLNLDGDYVLFTDPKKMEENSALEHLTCKYPDLREVLQKNDGNIDYVMQSTVTRLKNNETSEKTSVVYIIPFSVNDSGVNDMEDIYNKMKTLKETMPIHPVKRMNIVLTEGLNPEYLRKIGEYVFSNSNVKITFLVSKTKRKDVGDKTEKVQIERVVIKSGEATYADLLKNVKNSVDIRKVGVQVKAIKKTIKGDLLLEVEGGRKKADDLKQAIREKLDNEVRISSNVTVLHILDIDAATTTGEVEEAIKEIINNRDGILIKVKSIRPCRNGNQIATVQMSKPDAQILVKIGRIKVGWVNCRVKERIEVVRCFRCLDFGHRVSGCKGPDRSNICVKCGQEGHKARSCNNTQYCSYCKTSEHRTDSTRCPYFRKLIRDIEILKREGSKKTN